jgi:hypothetical protein
LKTIPLALLLVLLGALAARAAEVDAVDYDATIRIDTADKRLDGDVTLRLRLAKADDEVWLDAEELQVARRSRTSSCARRDRARLVRQLAPEMH